MIDFRYHVVSLVAVFLALAVGVVLGVGPLKDPVSNSLVTALTQETRQLQADKDAALAAVQRRDDFLNAAGPALTQGRLTGRSVVLVLLPGSDPSGLEPLGTALEAAGASVTGRVTVQPAWTDPTQAELRTRLATELKDTLPSGSLVTGSPEQVLAALLARATVTRELVSAGSPDAAGRTILDTLTGSDLIEVDGGALSGRATAALMVAPAVDAATAATGSPQIGSGLRSAVILARALDAGSAGAVVEGPTSAAGPQGLLAQIRQDDVASAEISTVDSGGTPMGDISTVLALSEQLIGKSGSYGFAADADQPMPLPTKAAG